MDKVMDRYDIATDSVMFQAGEPFDVAAVGRAQTPWWNRTLCAVNDAVVRLGHATGHKLGWTHAREVFKDMTAAVPAWSATSNAFPSPPRTFS